MRKILSATAVVAGLTMGAFGGQAAYGEFAKDKTRTSEYRVELALAFQDKLKEYRDLPDHERVAGDTPRAREYRSFSRGLNQLMQDESVSQALRDHSAADYNAGSGIFGVLVGVALISAGVGNWKKKELTLS